MKKHISLILSVFTLVMVLLVIGYLVLANTITMHAKQDKYLIGTTNISTTLRNRTLQTITYGAAFELEYLVDGEWVKMGREATTINFEAWGKSLLPFTSASIDTVNVAVNPENVTGIVPSTSSPIVGVIVPTICVHVVMIHTHPDSPQSPGSDLHTCSIDLRA